MGSCSVYIFISGPLILLRLVYLLTCGIFSLEERSHLHWMSIALVQVFALDLGSLWFFLINPIGYPFSSKVVVILSSSLFRQSVVQICLALVYNVRTRTCLYLIRQKLWRYKYWSVHVDFL